MEKFNFSKNFILRQYSFQNTNLFNSYFSTLKMIVQSHIDHADCTLRFKYRKTHHLKRKIIDTIWKNSYSKKPIVKKYLQQLIVKIIIVHLQTYISIEIIEIHLHFTNIM